MSNASLFDLPVPGKLAPPPSGAPIKRGGFMSKNGAVFRKKSGHRDLPNEELRTHCVSVRLNDAELAELDKVRRRFQRGEAMRMLALTSLPVPVIVPEINHELAVNIGRSFGNLTTIATAMRGGEYVDLAQIKNDLVELQIALVEPR